MALKKPQQKLKNWTKEKWKTKSGKKSSETGERYMPKKAIKKLSSSEYAATTRKKRAGTAKGKQFVKNTPKAAAAVKSSRIKAATKKKSVAKKTTAKKTTTKRRVVKRKTRAKKK